MASNNSKKEIFDDLLTEDQNKRSQQPSGATFDVFTAEEGQHALASTLTTDATKANIENRLENENPPIHMENNSGILFISAGTFRTSNVKAPSINDLTKMLNITIDKNVGVIIICNNVYLNSDQFNVQSNNMIEELETKIQCEHGIIPSNEPGTGDGSHSNRSAKDDSVNRSEFCLPSVLV